MKGEGEMGWEGKAYRAQRGLGSGDVAKGGRWMTCACYALRGHGQVPACLLDV